jgi:hypothetical protein
MNHQIHLIAREGTSTLEPSNTLCLWECTPTVNKHKPLVFAELQLQLTITYTISLKRYAYDRTIMYSKSLKKYFWNRRSSTLSHWRSTPTNEALFTLILWGDTACSWSIDTLDHWVGTSQVRNLILWFAEEVLLGLSNDLLLICEAVRLRLVSIYPGCWSVYDWSDMTGTLDHSTGTLAVLKVNYAESWK